jgi:hypothetical protein
METQTPNEETIMLSKNIKPGMLARVKVGDRLAVVTVLHQAAFCRRSRNEWICRTHDTDRVVHATAARLRPIPGTPEAEAERSRKIAAERRRLERTPARPATVQPAPALVAPVAVDGMIRRVNAGRLVERLVGGNLRAVERIVGDVHAAASWRDACRAVFAVVGEGKRLRSTPDNLRVPLALRRGCWLAVAEIHARNRREYREVMGHAPAPSEGMITAAMMGDENARRSVLAG